MSLRVMGLVGALALALAATAAVAESNLSWKFDTSARTGSGAFAPVAPVAAAGVSTAAWACPNWVEAYAAGGFIPIGFVMFFR